MISIKNKLKIIGWIMFIPIFFVGCQMEDHDSPHEEKVKDVEVKASNGELFEIITIEGCEFYRGYSGKKLSKVDCDCIPDKSKRK